MLSVTGHSGVTLTQSIMMVIFWMNLETEEEDRTIVERVVQKTKAISREKTIYVSKAQLHEEDFVKFEARHDCFDTSRLG